MGMNRETLGLNVRRYRRRKGWTQRDLARALQAGEPYISRIECAHVNPSADMVLRIAQVLGVTPNDLYGVGGADENPKLLAAGAR